MPQGLANKPAAAGSHPKTAPEPDPATLARKEIIQVLKGPVCDRLKKLIPTLAGCEDVYATVMSNPELLHGCLQLLRKHRETFQDLMVDHAGQPVVEDDKTLRCERTVNDIVGMIVRSGARAYADRRFAPQAEEDKDKAPAMLAHPETRSLLEKLRAVVRVKWEQDPPKPAAKAKPGAKDGPVDAFYGAIKDHLDYDWQVPLIPHYAELPPRLIAELGRGLTALPNAEAIRNLADIGRRNMEGARKILSDTMMREMLDTQPLAAEGIAFLGKERYDYLHSAVYEKMGEKFWEMCVDNGRLEAMENKSAKELEELSSQLHILSGAAIELILDRMQFWQLAIFLEVGIRGLGEEKFQEIFGIPGNIALVKRFTEKAAMIKADRPEVAVAEFTEKMPAIFSAYVRDPKGFEKGW